MEQTEHVIGGRKYQAIVDGSGNAIIMGPPEGLVDELGLPEPFATTLHNILYARGILTYRDVVKKSKELIGALQEALNLDAQRLQEMYFKYSQEVRND
ncbi:MAG: hypothetical protein EHM33_01890 [Chloroflexi bacterium]|nr:MAG: hypothetical protein EHM33_01890 [Chloroflexota bacterium]